MASKQIEFERLDASQLAAATDVQGMLAGTRILTLDGSLPVEYLTPGDRVLTRAGARRVRQIEVTVIRNARVVRVSQDALGLGKPQDDVTVTASMGILVRDWRAKALFGASQAVVPAQRLADGTYIRAETLAEGRLYTLVFDEPAVIYAGGLELACDGVVAKV